MGIAGVRLRGVVKRYGRFRLEVGELEFARGTNLIVGPNGSGKTTLIKVASGITFPDRGVVRLVDDGGRELDPRSAADKISVVLEDVELPPLKVRDLVEAYLGESASEAAREYGLGGVLDKRYDDLSSGFKKRVQLAIGLAADADVFLVDEPLANIDPGFAPIIRERLEELSRRKVVVIISHQELGYEPDRVVLLDDGKVKYQGPGRDPYAARIRLLVRVGGERRYVSLGEANRLLVERGLAIERVDVLSMTEALMEASREEGKAG